jgi:L-ascorbate metabolism protein UlaG (beta-lactamase superfamily)
VAQSANGSVKVEWFGWSHYRLTSPTGKVILTNPFTSNPDSPIKPADIGEADLIVVADGHGDEVGSTVEIGATVLAPGGVNSWLVEQGIPRAQVPQELLPARRSLHRPRRHHRSLGRKRARLRAESADDGGAVRRCGGRLFHHL